MTNTQTDANAFLMTSSVRSFKFERHSDTAKGTIASLDMQQQRDLKTGAPKNWDDGRPMMQLRVVLATDAHDDDEDDGLRAVYVRGQMQQAVRDAIKGAGVSIIEAGGILAVQYVGNGEKTNPAFNPPKQYRAKYEPPTKETATVSADDLF
jgi:hypothetical protein